MIEVLIFPICSIFPVWFHCTIFRRLRCFRLTIVLEKYRLHNMSRHKLATVFWNSMCQVSFMTRFNKQRCRCFTIRWEFGLLNSMRHCTLPYVPLLWPFRASYGMSSVSYMEEKWPRYIESGLYKVVTYEQAQCILYLLFTCYMYLLAVSVVVHTCYVRAT